MDINGNLITPPRDGAGLSPADGFPPHTERQPLSAVPVDCRDLYFIWLVFFFSSATMRRL